ncbi:cytochrome P450 [Actinophytocola sp.]|uniref:cytochrome P450 n=1 Tax=Actinophytocola sp. TaxID=1872138 RepID=UPI002D7F46EB|nr:cytochrome P450 [Actinophytocola sp.]HET9143891.1 cytochrome P450 [Actinophytocola sp.]
MSTVPRFTGLPLLGVGPRFLRDPVATFMAAHQRHGDLVELDLGPGGSIYGVFHPDGVRQVLGKGRRVHRQLLRQLLGKGLFTSPSGEDWLRRRRLLQPLFTAERLAEMVPSLLRSFDTALHTRWEHSARINVAEEMKQATVAMMIDATFGHRAAIDYPAARAALAFLLTYVDERLFRVVKAPGSWPTHKNRRYTKEIAVLRGTIAEVMRNPRFRRDDGPTFLGGLLELRGEAKFTDEELTDEVLSIFIAGTETTGTALTWALHLLSRHPEAAAALSAEVAGTLGARTPTAAGLSQLSWPKAVVQEAIRLYPPAWALRRVLDAPTEIGDATLPAGASVMVSAYVTHRHPGFWVDPERFDPTRWLPGAPAKAPRFAYFPFGAGAHQCTGNLFALLEGELILTRVAQRFRTAPVTELPVRTRPTIALAPVPAPHLTLTAA